MLQQSLPPLPSGRETPNIDAFLDDQKSVELPPVIDQDEALQKHLVRVQKSILDSVDSKIDEYVTQLRDTKNDLKKTEDEKVMVGEALYVAKTEVARLNAALSKT